MKPIKATVRKEEPSAEEIKPLRQGREDKPPRPSGPGDITRNPGKDTGGEEGGPTGSHSVGPG